MMFALRDFIKMGLMDAVGKLADYQVILNAAGWNEKGVLTIEDLSDIQSAIEKMHIADAPVVEDPSIETFDAEV